MINKNLTNQQLLNLIAAHRAEVDSAKLRLARAEYLDENGEPMTITDACWLTCLGREAIAYDKHQLRQDRTNEESNQIEEDRTNF
jgi:hypothetical protein